MNAIGWNAPGISVETRQALRDADEALLREWKGCGGQTLRVNPHDEEYRLEFMDSGFSVSVECDRTGFPLIDDEARELLHLYLEEKAAAWGAH